MWILVYGDAMPKKAKIPDTAQVIERLREGAYQPYRLGGIEVSATTPRSRPQRRYTRRPPVRIAENDVTWEQREYELVQKAGWDCGGCMGHFPANVPWTVTPNGWRCASCL